MSIEVADVGGAVIVTEGAKIHASFSYVKYSPQSRVGAYRKAEGFKLGMLYQRQIELIKS